MVDTKNPAWLESAGGVSSWREELASDCEPDQPL